MKAASSTPTKSYRNLLRFSFCASGICLCYWFYGIMQENLISNSGLGATFILAVQSVANIFVALLWQRVESAIADRQVRADPDLKKQRQQQLAVHSDRSLNHPLLFVTSAFYVFAMIGSNEALRYVSYPTAVLAKSCKLLPTMLMGVLIERRVYSARQWGSALAISIGMSLFHMSRIHQTSAPKDEAAADLVDSDSDSDNDGGNTDDDDESWKGMTLLMCSLACDGFLGSCQGMLKRSDTKFSRQRPPSAVETMLYSNLYALFFLIPVAVLDGQWDTGMHLMTTDSQLRFSIFALNAVVSIGQIFIFLTLTWYSSLACTTITTTRKFFTILLSVLYFGHRFSTVQWCAVGLVFFGLYLATVSKQFSGGQSERIAAVPSNQGSLLMKKKQ